MKRIVTTIWLRSGVAAVLALVGTGLLLALIFPPAPPSPNVTPSPSSVTPSPGAPWFVDVAAAGGIGFRHFDPATPRNYILETMGTGLGWIDYDNDGWLDLFCVQDGPVQPSSGDSPPPTNKLYRNHGDGTFADVTATVGLARAGFGMGCAVGDYDNDGYDDLVVTYWGGIVLYHNESDGRGGRRFVDVTGKAGGLPDPHWATSCGFGDVDGDGDLDLYVCNYVEVDLARYPLCKHDATQIIFNCPPSQFASVTHRLYRNNGDGTFVDVSGASGIAAASPAPGLGVILTDLDGDGRIDIYAANDMRPAYLFHNQGGGKFIEKGILSGCALGSSGENIAGMGVDAGDVDDSGRPSLFVTNFHGVPNILFLNAGRMLFRYGTHRSGLGVPSLERLGFGTVFCDVDLDGRLDVAVANGHVERHSARVYNAPYAQKAQLFLGQGSGRFRDGSAESGAYFLESRVGRGLAWADFDNDGRPDLAFGHVGGQIALLHNRTESANGWLRLELVGDGKASNRNAIGARVEIETAAGKLVRFVNGGGSYLSASERRLLVGLGPQRRAERVAVRWPSGREQIFTNLEGQRWWRLYEGQKLPVAVEPQPPVKGL